MAKVILSEALSRQIRGKKNLLIEGDTVRNVLIELIASYPLLRQYCLNDKNELQPFVSYFINKKDIKSLQGINTKVLESDTLTIIPAIAGG